MGMFGAIYFITTLIGSGIEGISRSIEKRQSYNRCSELRLKGKNPTGIYFDHSGRTYDLDTGKQVMFYYEKGHYMEKVVGGEVLRDFTQEELDKEVLYNANNPNGKQVIRYYSIRDLRRMWDEKYNKGKDRYLYKNYPHTRNNDYVNMHCKTKRLCATYGYNISKAYRDAIEQYKGKRICNCSFFIDLITGEVLDIDRRVGGISYYTDNKDINGREIVKFLTEEEEKDIVRFINQKIHTGDLPRNESPWISLFKEENV